MTSSRTGLLPDQTRFSINTLSGRIKVPFEKKGMEAYWSGSWSFGTAKLVQKRGKFFLHIPMKKEVTEVTNSSIHEVVGVDIGINFVVTSYHSGGCKECSYRSNDDRVGAMNLQRKGIKYSVKWLCRYTYAIGQLSACLS